MSNVIDPDVFIKIHDTAANEVIALLKQNEGITEDRINLAMYSLDVHCVTMLHMIDKMNLDKGLDKSNAE